MKAAAVTATLLTVLGLASPAGASAGADYRVEGGTPEQRALISDVLSWGELPPVPHPFTVTVVEGSGNFGGCSGMVLGSVWTVSILHEFGHVWDCQRMDGEWRHFIMECGDYNCRAGSPPFGWYGGSYDVTPAERFAQSFAAEVLDRRTGLRDYLWWEPYPPKLIGRVMDALTPNVGSCL